MTRPLNSIHTRTYKRDILQARSASNGCATESTHPELRCSPTRRVATTARRAVSQHAGRGLSTPILSLFYSFNSFRRVGQSCRSSASLFRSLELIQPRSCRVSCRSSFSSRACSGWCKAMDILRHLDREIYWQSRWGKSVRTVSRRVE